MAMKHTAEPGNGQAQTPQDVVLEYLKQSYGVEFSYLGEKDIGFTSTRALLFSCAAYPGETIVVEYRSLEQRDFRDNFLAVRYADKVRELVHERTLTEFSDALVYYQPTVLAPSQAIPVEASFEEYLAQNDVALNLTVEVRASELTRLEKARRVANLLSEQCANYRLMILAVDEVSFGQLTDEEMGKRISAGNFSAYASFTRIRNETSEKWVEGSSK